MSQYNRSDMMVFKYDSVVRGSIKWPHAVERHANFTSGKIIFACPVGKGLRIIK